MAVYPSIRDQQVQFQNFVFNKTIFAPNANHANRYLNENAIPYNLMGGSQRWTYADQGMSYQESWVVRAQDVPYLAGLLPQVVVSEMRASSRPDGEISLFPLPGNPLLICKGISVEGLTRKKPLDSYEVDSERLTLPAVWLDKYDHLAVATLNFEYDSELVETQNFNLGDISLADSLDLGHYSVITSETKVGGEFLAVGQPNTRFQPVKRVLGGNYTLIAGNPDDNGHDLAQNELGNQEFIPLNVNDDAFKPNDDYEVPLTFVVAHLEHKVTWKNVWRVPWGNIKRLLGKVNNAPLEWLGNAARQTVLFTGAEIHEQPMRHTGGGKLYTVTYTFSERHIRLRLPRVIGDDPREGNVILGWNHVYRPKDSVWVTAVLNANRELLYREDNFLLLFRHDVNPPIATVLRLDTRGNSTNPLRPHAHNYVELVASAPPPAMLIG